VRTKTQIITDSYLIDGIRSLRKEISQLTEAAAGTGKIKIPNDDCSSDSSDDDVLN
jgi:hypothetical protein